MFKRLLVFLGLRSKCCFARIRWWSDRKAICSNCGEVIYNV